VIASTPKGSVKRENDVCKGDPGGSGAFKVRFLLTTEQGGTRSTSEKSEKRTERG